MRVIIGIALILSSFFCGVLEYSDLFAEDRFPNLLSEADTKEILNNIRFSTKHARNFFLNSIKGTGSKLDYQFGKLFDSACRNLEILLDKDIEEDIDRLGNQKNMYNLLFSYRLLYDLGRLKHGFDQIFNIMQANTRVFGKEGVSIVNQIIEIETDFFKHKDSFEKHFVDLIKAKDYGIELLATQVEDCKEQLKVFRSKE